MKTPNFEFMKTIHSRPSSVSCFSEYHTASKGAAIILRVLFQFFHLITYKHNFLFLILMFLNNFIICYLTKNQNYTLSLFKQISNRINCLCLNIILTLLNFDTMEKITIEKIAEMLNVSKSTVSRAFRDSYDINPETKDKILKMAKELNFEPNSIAQSLRDKKTKRIGVIIPSFTIPFYASAICGIQEVAVTEGYNLLICQSDESYENEVLNIKSLIQSRVDGIILSVSKETTNFSHIIQLRDNGVPIVLFNRTTDIPQVSKVRVDDCKGSYEITEYLISKGYRKIAYLAGPKNLILTQNRFKGFKAAMNDKKIDIDENAVIFGDFCMESGMERCEQLLSNFKPDAIYCICDNVAFGVIKYLKENNYRIPEDIAVAGFTDEPVASLIDPPLTTIRQPIKEIGKKAAELLFKQFKYSNTKPEVVLLPTELIIRKST